MSAIASPATAKEVDEQLNKVGSPIFWDTCPNRQVQKFCKRDDAIPCEPLRCGKACSCPVHIYILDSNHIYQKSAVIWDVDDGRLWIKQLSTQYGLHQSPRTFYALVTGRQVSLSAPESTILLPWLQPAYKDCPGLTLLDPRCESLYKAASADMTTRSSISPEPMTWLLYIGNASVAVKRMGFTKLKKASFCPLCKQH